MCRIFLLISLLLFIRFGFAQEETRVVDSLQAVMNHQEGRQRIETMLELSRAFFDFSYDDCIAWGEEAVRSSVQFGDNELIAKAYWKMGLRYLNHYDFDLAENQFLNALKFLEGQEDSELLMDVLNYKGRVELFLGEISQALDTYQKALAVSQHLDDAMNCADVTNNLAYIYFHQDDLEKALAHFNLARQQYERLGDTLSAAQCDNNVSNIFVQRQQFDKAKSILQRAIPVFRCFDDESSLAHAYQNLGTVYAIGLVNFDSALFYLQKSVICAENVGDEIVLIEDEIEIANVLMQLGHDKEAMSLYQSALHSSETIGYQKGVMEAYKSLGTHYHEKGDFTTSAVYLKRCLDMAEESGNNLYINSVRPYLITDYAHLGRFAEMKNELGLFQDDYASAFNESTALSEKLANLQDDAEGLLAQYESQNEQLTVLEAQRDYYRLAFFGLLGIALFTLAALTAYKIVRKNRPKI